MDETAPADFYTGIVVDVYGPLRGSVPDSSVYAAFIGVSGEPALELALRRATPLLLRGQGIDVATGVDAGLRRGILASDGSNAAPDASEFGFLLRRADVR